MREAGVSARSVKGVGHGVCWASNNGLCYHGQRGTFNMTKGIIARDTWRALNPAGIIGAMHEGYYIGIYSPTQAFMIDTMNPVGVIWLTFGGHGVFEDTISGNLFVVGTGNVVNKFDAGSVLTALFKGKVARTRERLAANFVRVDASQYPVTFRLWADGVLTETVSVTNSNPTRLGGGANAMLWQAEVSGPGPIEGVSVATDHQDLP